MLENLKGQNVVVTGHTGFSGTWLTLILEKFGANVLGISVDCDESRIAYHSASFTTLQEKFIDINDYEKIYTTILSFNPSICFHLAAQPILSIALKEPKMTFETNVLGTLNILEIFRNVPTLKVLVVTTTDKVYDENSDMPFFESSPMWGSEIYSGSKVAAEAVIDAYCRSFNDFFKKENKQIAVLRAGNIFGGGDWSQNRLVPDIFRAISLDSQVTIRKPEFIRPWQHVYDVCLRYALVSEKLNSSYINVKNVWNIATQEKVISVREFATMFEQSLKDFDCNLEFKYIDNLNLYENPNLILSSSKFEKEFGKIPALDIRHAIELTSEWYLNYFAKHEKSSENFTKLQIDNLVQEMD